MELSHGAINNSRSPLTDSTVMRKDWSTSSDSIVLPPSPISYNSPPSTLNVLSENPEKTMPSYFCREYSTSTETHSLPLFATSACTSEWQDFPQIKRNTEPERGSYFLTGKHSSPCSSKSGVDLDFPTPDSCTQQPLPKKLKTQTFQPSVPYWNQKLPGPSESQKLLERTNLYTDVVWINDGKILSLSPRTVQRIKHRLVLPKTGQLSKISHIVMKHADSTDPKVPKRFADRCIFPTAHKSKGSTRHIPCSVPTTPQETSGEGDRSTSNSESIPGKIFCSTANKTAGSARDDPFTSDPETGHRNDNPHMTIIENQHAVVKNSSGDHEDVANTSDIESKSACGEDHSIEMSEARDSPEEDHGPTPSDQQKASRKTKYITVSGTRIIPDHLSCFPPDSLQCTPTKDHCTKVTKTGGGTRETCTPSCSPKVTFEYVLCPMKKKKQTEEDVPAPVNQRVLFFPVMPADQDGRRQPPASSPQQAQTFMPGRERQQDDTSALRKEQNPASFITDGSGWSQTGQNTAVKRNSASSSDLLESPMQNRQMTERLLNSEQITEQALGAMHINLSQSTVTDKRKTLTDCRQAMDDCQILLPSGKNDSNTKCLWPEKMMSHQYGVCLHEGRAKTIETTHRTDEVETAMAGKPSGWVTLQEHLSRRSAIPRPGNGLCGPDKNFYNQADPFRTEESAIPVTNQYGSVKNFHARSFLCKTEKNSECHETEKSDYVLVKTEVDRCCLSLENDREKFHEKENAAEIIPRKEWSNATHFSLAGRSKPTSNPQKLMLVKFSPSKVHSKRENFEPYSQDSQSSKEVNKTEFQEESLPGSYAHDPNCHDVLPNSLVSFAENNYASAGVEKFPAFTCEKGHKESLEQAKYLKDSFRASLKILETVSLASLVPCEQKLYSQLNSPSGFYRCGGCGGTCPFRSQFQFDLASHLQEVHPQEEDYLCVHCGCRESSPGLLLYHLDHHLDFQRFSLYCTQPDCNFHSFSPDDVINHMAICHPHLDAHVCWCCSHWLGTLQQLKMHIQHNLLYVTLCPYCDAKDTDADRLLHHITMTHPSKGRMIIFHKLLMCGERKMSGQQTSETSFVHTSVPVSTDQSKPYSGKTNKTTPVTVSYHLDDASSVAVVNTDRNGNEYMTGFRSEDKARRQMKEQDRGESYDQRAAEKGTKPQIVLHHPSEKETQKIKINAQVPPNDNLGNDPVSTKGAGHLTTAKQQQEQMNSAKLIFKRKGTHFECFDKQALHLSDRDKLSMDPVDLEISVDDSAEQNHDYPLQSNKDPCGCEVKDEAAPSTESVKTPAASPLVSSTISPETPKQDKFYKCTVVSAGRSIKLVSSKTLVKAGSPNRASAENPVSGISTRSHSDAAPRQITLSHPEESKLYSCRLCSFTSHLSRRIYLHMYSRHGHILDCPKCGQRSKTRTALFNHLKKRHAEEAKALFYQNKVTKWIQITPRDEKKVKSKDSHITPVLSALNEQDCPVNNYFVIANHSKERSIHCVLCDYSFKKYHRSNASVYRSMYKHLFLRHIPHEFQCPVCRFTHDREERIRRHMKEKHTGSDQEPEVIVLSQRPTQNILYSHPRSEGSATRHCRDSNYRAHDVKACLLQHSHTKQKGSEEESQGTCRLCDRFLSLTSNAGIGKFQDSYFNLEVTNAQ